MKSQKTATDAGAELDATRKYGQELTNRVLEADATAAGSMKRLYEKHGDTISALKTVAPMIRELTSVFRDGAIGVGALRGLGGFFKSSESAPKGKFPSYTGGKD